MALVLQRRVLVMGPRIILRGATPIDSNIGGFGHRSPHGEVVSCVCSHSSCVFFSWLVGVSSGVEPFSLLSLVFSSLSWIYGTTVVSHGTTARVGGFAFERGPPGARYYRYLHGSNF